MVQQWGQSLQAQAAVEQQILDAQPKPPAPPKNWKKVQIGLGIGGGVLVAAIVLVAALTNKSSGPVRNVTQAQMCATMQADPSDLQMDGLSFDSFPQSDVDQITMWSEQVDAGPLESELRKMSADTVQLNNDAQAQADSGMTADSVAVGTDLSTIQSDQNAIATTCGFKLESGS